MDYAGKSGKDTKVADQHLPTVNHFNQCDPWQVEEEDFTETSTSFLLQITLKS